MSAVYLLDCNCGRSVELRQQQAGSTLDCPECGTEITAPTFRELSKLPRSDKSGSVAKNKTSWSRKKGLLFALGLPLLLMGAMTLGYVGLKYSKLETKRPTLEQVKSNWNVTDEQISQLTPSQAWDQWKKASGVPVGRPGDPVYEHQRRIAKQYNIYLGMGGLLGLTGLGLLGAMMFVND